MTFRTKLLGSASALLLIGAASGAAYAEESIQNEWLIEMMNPAHVTMDQTVDGIEGRGATDAGSRRDNTIRGDYSNRMVGLGHDQQNNGNNNAIGVESNVLVNTGDSDDLTQNLWMQGTSQNGTYVDAPVGDGHLAEAARINLITNAYQNVQGVIDQQQNNGDGNVMGIEDVVSANLGAEPFGQSSEGHDDTTQKVRVSGTVDNNNSTDTNRVTGNPRLVTGERTNTINGRAFQNFLGLASVQQNNGNGNVIQVGTAVIADIGTAGNSSGTEDADMYVKADGTVTNNISASSSSPGPSISPVDRDNLITNAFRGGVSGIVNAQQNNGDNNSMNVANGVRVAYMSNTDIDNVGRTDGAKQEERFGGLSVWTDADVSNNRANDLEQNRDNLLTGNSFRGATGMFTVQQNNGDNNAMNSATGVVASLFSGNGDGNDVMAGAAARANVENNTSTVNVNSDRRNRVQGNVFNNAAGIVAVQQNNGDNNAINASKAIVASFGEGPDFKGFNGDVMADTYLKATVTGNTATIFNTAALPGYENLLTNSFQGFKGIKTVQQNNGNNNAIQSSVTVVGNINALGGGAIPPLPLPGE